MKHDGSQNRKLQLFTTKIDIFPFPTVPIGFRTDSHEKMAFARQSRVMKELRMLQQSPAPGISCWQSGSENEESRSSDTENSLEKLEAAITGPDGTPYEGGIFQVGIQIGSRYPFEPPKCRFKTKIYHPNVDDAGRICLDLLKMPPAGAWRPAINIATLLKSLQLLLSQPNPDDALVPDIAVWRRCARGWGWEHSMEHCVGLILFVCLFLMSCSCSN